MAPAPPGIDRARAGQGCSARRARSGDDRRALRRQHTAVVGRSSRARPHSSWPARERISDATICAPDRARSEGRRCGSGAEHRPAVAEPPRCSNIGGAARRVQTRLAVDAAPDAIGITGRRATAGRCSATAIPQRRPSESSTIRAQSWRRRSSLALVPRGMRSALLDRPDDPRCAAAGASGGGDRHRSPCSSREQPCPARGRGRMPGGAGAIRNGFGTRTAVARNSGAGTATTRARQLGRAIQAPRRAARGSWRASAWCGRHAARRFPPARTLAIPRAREASRARRTSGVPHSSGPVRCSGR